MLAVLALGDVRCRCEDAGARVPERPLPGAPALPEALRVQLHEVAAARRAAGTPPRTRHVDASGAPLYVNRLALETSPYLLQHAHNPVSWWPWGEAAFAEARRLNRPVLLSVGYSTCHWCHVMEEESFDDEATARELNQRYIAIKVDREVRPDLDAVYMNVVSMLHGSGGWPMTVWLTPDRRPFHAGTYFPGTAQPGRPAFRTVLTALADEYARAPDTARGRAAERPGGRGLAGKGRRAVRQLEIDGPPVTHAQLRAAQHQHGARGHHRALDAHPVGEGAVGRVVIDHAEARRRRRQLGVKARHPRVAQHEVVALRGADGQGLAAGHHPAAGVGSGDDLDRQRAHRQHGASIREGVDGAHPSISIMTTALRRCARRCHPTCASRPWSGRHPARSR